MTRTHDASNTTPRRRRALLLCSAAFCATTAPLSALPQHAADRDRAHLVARHSSNAARVYTDDGSATPQFSEARLSPNVAIAPALQSIVAAMLRDSVTFRRQCARLAASPSILVTVDDAVIPDRAPFRAATDFSVDSRGQVIARVRLGSRTDVEARIAHEFEHIIEQLDGVDLRSLARRETAGVHPVYADTHFETERAIAIGRRVAQEIRTSRQKGM